MHSFKDVCISTVLHFAVTLQFPTLQPCTRTRIVPRLHFCWNKTWMRFFCFAQGPNIFSSNKEDKLIIKMSVLTKIGITPYGVIQNAMNDTHKQKTTFLSVGYLSRLLTTPKETPVCWFGPEFSRMYSKLFFACLQEHFYYFLMIKLSLGAVCLKPSSLKNMAVQAMKECFVIYVHHESLVMRIYDCYKVVTKSHANSLARQNVVWDVW